MFSIKPGRGPSAMSAAAGIFTVIFGIFWTILAITITRNFSFPLVGIIFPIFGVGFVILGIAGVAYNLRNTASKNRFSTFDITSSNEEADPLNKIFGAKNVNAGSAATVEQRLQELDTLRTKSLINEAEYTAQRNRILGQI